MADYGVAGINPEPRAGYRSAQVRDRFLEEFCISAWQRHIARHTQHNVQPWPTRQTFKNNWPHLGPDLIVGAWKLATAEHRFAPPEAGLEREHWLYGTAIPAVDPEVAEVEIPEELLDPAPPPERDWRDVYAAELADFPALLIDLEQPGPGDGIELVLEKAGLKPGERAVIRPWLYGIEDRIIAEDLGWSLQRVTILLVNGRDRLKWLVHDRPRRLRTVAVAEPGNYQGRSSSGNDSDRAGGSPVSGPVDSGRALDAQPSRR